MRRLVQILMMGAVGCGSVHGSHAVGEADAGPPTDDAAAAVIDAATIDSNGAPPTDAGCDALATFGARTPLVIGGMTGIVARSPRLSADELTVYFNGHVGTGDENIYVATRPALTAAFGTATLVTEANSTSSDSNPSLSPDGATLWFDSNRAGQGNHIYVATRASPQAAFGTPTLASVNASDATVNSDQPFLTADGKELWFASSRAPNIGNLDIWRAEATATGFAAPVPVTEASSDQVDFNPTPSADRLTLYVSSGRTGTGAKGNNDVWRSHRGSIDDGFPPFTPVLELNTADSDHVSWISADSCRIYGTTVTSTTSTMYVATRTAK